MMDGSKFCYNAINLTPIHHNLIAAVVGIESDFVERVEGVSTTEEILIHTSIVPTHCTANVSKHSW